MSRRELKIIKENAEMVLRTTSDATEAGRLTRALAYSRLMVVNAIMEDE